MSQGDDKRRDNREAVTLFVEYEGADDLIGDYTENLSSGGTFVATNRELPVGTRIQLVLGFPGLLEPIAIEGVVRWTRDRDQNPGAGIEFSAGPGRDQLGVVGPAHPVRGTCERERRRRDRLERGEVVDAAQARPPALHRPARQLRDVARRLFHVDTLI